MNEAVYVADGYSLQRFEHGIRLHGWQDEAGIFAHRYNDKLLYGFFDEILQEHEGE